MLTLSLNLSKQLQAVYIRNKLKSFFNQNYGSIYIIGASENKTLLRQNVPDKCKRACSLC